MPARSRIALRAAIVAIGLVSGLLPAASAYAVCGNLIIEASIAIHEKLGPGLLESVYQAVLPQALARRGLLVEAQRNVPFEFEGMRFQQGLTVDLLVDGQVVVELKSVEKLAPVHFKQVVTYLRLLDLRVGLLVNFGGATLKEGLHRIVNNRSTEFVTS